MKTGTDYIADIIINLSKMQNEQDKIDYLRSVNNPALKHILIFAYNDKYTTSYKELPKYTPDDSPIGLSISSLQREYTRIPYFLNTTQYIKNDVIRNRKLINILEAVHWTESSVLEAIVLKKQLPHISKELALKAFPDLLTEK
jgi:transposase